jgi:3-hydroxyisobutyrate dehydrogenase-like beta-hydroxyacid dehydrogenase
MRVAFVGLGVMGFPMAGHWAAAGLDVAVYNRTGSRAEQWAAAHGGTVADTPAAAASGAEVVCLCVGDDADVRAVVLGDDGVLAALEPGAVLVDHTTASAALARELAGACAERGVGFLDAPVSGGQAGAEQGRLTIMVGGEADAFERACPVLEPYARAVRLLGPAGSGQLAKMVNQICIAGILQGLSEGIAFGERAGLDVAAVLDVIGKGAAQSWQLDQRSPTMLEDRFDFGFAVDWMRKDLHIALDEGRRNGARLPLTALVDQFYADVQALGGGRWDTSSLVKRLREGPVGE